MFNKLKWMVLCGSLLAFSACDKEAPAEPAEPTEPAETTGAAAEPAEAPESGASDAPSGDGPVEVAADGTKFDPPVKKDQIPAGAWFCDMGTVHYAQTDAGEKCPLCGMKLVVKKGTHKAEPAADGHGHDHGEGDHDHAHGDGHDHDH